MVLKDYKEFYVFANSELSKLNSFESSLQEICDLYNNYSKSFINDCYLGKIKSDNSFVYISTLKSRINTLITNIEAKFRNINLYEIGLIFNNIQNNLENNKFLINSDSINLIITQVHNINMKIFKFLNGNYDCDDSNDKEIEFSFLQSLISDINTLLSDLNKFKSDTYLLSNISKSIENNTNLLENENYNSIELYYYNQDINLSAMSTILNNIDKLYNNICNLCDISTTQYKFAPKKIESGSLFMELLGNDQVLELIKMILTGISVLYFKNFTKQGKFEENIQNIKSTLDIIKMSQEVGLSIKQEDQSNLDGIISQVINNAKDLICAGDLSVDGKKINEINHPHCLLGQNMNKYLNEPDITTEELHDDNN